MRPFCYTPALLRSSILLLLLACTAAMAQENARQDSLLRLLKTAPKDTGYVELLNELAFELSSTGSVQSIRYSRQALALSNELGYGTGVARSYNNIGLYYDYAGQYDSAMFYYSRAVEQNQEMGDKSGLAGNYLNMGGSYLYQGLYKPALENTLKAYNIYSVLGNEKRVVSCLNNMGVIYRATKEYKKALDNYVEVLRIRKRNNDERGLMVTYTNMGVVYQNLKDYHNFLAYSDTSLQLARKVGNVNDISGSMLNVGLAYIRLKRYAEARGMIEQALLLTRNNGDNNNKAYTYAALGELNAEQGKHTEAIELYKKSLVLARELHRRELKKALYAYLHQSYKKLGRFEDAMICLEQERALNDSLLNEETIRHTNEMDAVYRTAEKEKENQRLKTENEVQKLSAQWSNTQRNIFIVVSVIVLLLLLFILRAYLGKQKTNRLLEANKKLVEQSLFEKETLLKEVHHRVKNNLQIISSLLELQLNRISDEAIIALLKESKNRIESMALIHKKLYTHNNFAAIDAGSYLNDLVNSLRASYLRPGVQLEIVYNTEAMDLNTETAVPLGLVVTEIVSNALKHAVSSSKVNRIELKLEKLKQNGFELRIKDNGPGMESPGKLFEGDSLGLKLVRILSKQLEGEADFTNEDGLVFTLKGKIID